MRTQLAPIGVLIDVGAGDCWGEQCTWAGTVEAVHDPYDMTAEWKCPGCGTYVTTEIPE